MIEPLKLIGVDNFFHNRVDKKGAFSTLKSCPEFFKTYIAQRHYFSGLNAATGPLPQYLDWSTLEFKGDTERMEQTAQSFDQQFTFSVIEEHHGVRDIYHFTSSEKDVSFKKCHRENINLLHAFIQYYLNQLNQTPDLKRAHEIKFAFPRYKRHFESNLSDLYISTENLRNHFAAGAKLIYEGRTFSRREVEVLSWLAYGKTFPEIALLMNIKLRTIKFHVENLKEKLACTTLFQLGEKFASIKVRFGSQYIKVFLNEPTTP